MRRILERDRAECAEYLRTHAYHPGKFLLAQTDGAKILKPFMCMAALAHKV